MLECGKGRGHAVKKILVCEDETSIREFVVINLKRAGYEVVEAGSGEEAVEKYDAEQGSVDIALLDIMLPGMDGFAVCRELRQRSETMGIIMLTARTQEMEKVGGLMMGADDYVTKPFSPSELVARVDALYRRVTAVRSRNEVNYLEKIESGAFEKGRPAGGVDPGGISNYGIFLHQSGQGAQPYRNPDPGVGRRVFRGRKNRGRQHPPPADEDRGRSLGPQVYPDCLGHGI